MPELEIRGITTPDLPRRLLRLELDDVLSFEFDPRLDSLITGAIGTAAGGGGGGAGGSAFSTLGVLKHIEFILSQFGSPAIPSYKL